LRQQGSWLRSSHFRFFRLAAGRVAGLGNGDSGARLGREFHFGLENWMKWSLEHDRISFANVTTRSAFDA
jgi:hypothetical protein